MKMAKLPIMKFLLRVLYRKLILVWVQTTNIFGSPVRDADGRSYAACWSIAFNG